MNRNFSIIKREIIINSINGKYLDHIANEIYINNIINSGVNKKSSNYKLIEHIKK